MLAIASNWFRIVMRDLMVLAATLKGVAHTPLVSFKFDIIMLKNRKKNEECQ